MPWGAAIGAIGAIGGGLLSSSASGSAANASSNASNNATNAQLQMFNTVQGNLQPYMQFGSNALGPLAGLLGYGGTGANSSQNMLAALQGMPGYQFTLDQGLKSTQNGFAARGLGSSGAAMKGAADFSTGLAQSQYSNYVNQLMGAAGLGENAAAGVGNAAVSTGQGIAGTIQNAGNAQAAGILGGANALNNAFGQAGNSYLTYSMLNGGGGNSWQNVSAQQAANGSNPLIGT